MFLGLFSKPAVQFDTSKDIPNLSGKIIAITGGNAGLGAETILRLAPHNPTHIYILARNASSTSDTIAHIQSVVPGCCPITHIPCDLADLSSVRSAAESFLEKEERLDILFLNAGIMFVPAGVTSQGYEMQFGVNHLAHFLLGELLLPVLRKTAEEGRDVRVVVLSSIGMAFMPWGIDYSSLKSAGSSLFIPKGYRYGRSKLSNALFALEFQRRYCSFGITCVAIHPGVIATGLWVHVLSFAQDWGKVGEWFKWLGRQIPVVGFETVESGVKGQLWGAVGRLGEGKGEVEGGRFYTPVGVPDQGTPASRDEAEAKRLWEWSEKEVAGFLR